MTDPDNMFSSRNLNVRDNKEEILIRLEADLKIMVAACVVVDVTYDELISVVNNVYVVAALETHGSQVAASKAAGMNRGTFRKMLKKAIEPESGLAITDAICAITEDDGA